MRAVAVAAVFFGGGAVDGDLMAVQPVLACHDLLHALWRCECDKADAAVHLPAVVARHVGVLQAAVLLKVAAELRVCYRLRDARHKDARGARCCGCCLALQQVLWQRHLRLAAPAVNGVVYLQRACCCCCIRECDKAKAPALAREPVLHDVCSFYCTILAEVQPQRLLCGVPGQAKHCELSGCLLLLLIGAARPVHAVFGV